MVISCLEFHSIALRRGKTRSFLIRVFCNKGSGQETSFTWKMQYTWKRPIVFSQRGSIQSIFVCVSKECISSGKKKYQSLFKKTKISFLQNYLFCEKLISYIGNYLNEGVRKQILNVEGSFHSIKGIPEVMNWWPFSKTFPFYLIFSTSYNFKWTEGKLFCVLSWFVVNEKYTLGVFLIYLI